MLKGHIRKFHGGHIFVCPYCNMSVRHRNSIRRHLENRHNELQQEWATPGFLDKLEAGGNVTSTNTLMNTTLAVPHHQLSSDSTTTIVTSQTSEHISPSSDVSLLQPDNQTEGTYRFLSLTFIVREQEILNFPVLQAWWLDFNLVVKKFITFIEPEGYCSVHKSAVEAGIFFILTTVHSILLSAACLEFPQRSEECVFS